MMYHLFLRFTRRCLPAGAFVFAFAVGLPSAFAAVQINEISYNPPGTDANHEWVEVVNTGPSSVDLTTWKFYQAGNHSLSAFQGSLNVPANGYAVLTGSGAVFMADHPGFTGTVVKTSFSLSNTGEELRMVDGGNATVDSVTYATTFANGNGFTLEKNASGQWVESLVTGGTPGEENSMIVPTPDPSPTATPTPLSSPFPSASPSPTPTASPTPTPLPPVAPGDVLINEFEPTPLSGQNEWIELYNFSGHAVDLSALTIEDATGAPHALSGTMAAGSYAVIEPSPVSLNNTGDTLILRRASDHAPIDQVSYGSAGSGNVLSTTGQSIGAYPDASLSGSGRTLYAFSSPTKGLLNTVLNHQPSAVITIQSPFTVSGPAPLHLNVTGESSSDPDGDTLAFLWQYGDGESSAEENPASKTYASQGTFTLRLTVTDPWGATATATQTITVTAPQGGGGGSAVAASFVPSCSSRVSVARVTINEFLPNPTGSDTTGEFIELYNDETLPVNVCGWSLDDGEGGSLPYTFTTDTLIPARGYRAFFVPTTGITLNNDKDTVRLLNPTGNEAGSVPYSSAPEASSFSRFTLAGKDVWKWALPTPDQENVLPPTIDGEDLEPTIASDVRISEIFPDPQGNDRLAEFIELENVGERVDLLGYQLRLGDSHFTFTTDTFLEHDAFLSLPYAQTKLALINAGGTLELLDPLGHVVDRLVYGKAVEGHSFALFEGDWVWTLPTSGQMNRNEPPIGGLPLTQERSFTVHLKQGKQLLYLQGATVPNADVFLKLFLLDGDQNPVLEEPDLELSARSSMIRGTFSAAMQIALDPGTYRVLAAIHPPVEPAFEDDTQTITISSDATQAKPKALSRAKKKASGKRKAASRAKTVSATTSSPGMETGSGELLDEPYIGGTTAEDAIGSAGNGKGYIYGGLLLFTLVGLGTIVMGKKKND